MPAKASPSSAIPIIGAAICRSIAACGISTNCGSIFIATATPISRPSRPGSTTCAAKPIRPAGRPVTTFPPCATAAWSRKRSPAACRNSFRLRLQHAPADFFRHPRAPGDRAVVRFRMDQPQFLLRSVPAQRELLRRFRTVAPTTGRPTQKNARCLRRILMRCAPTCSTAPGRRRSATVPAAIARRCAKRSACSTPPDTS